jgi:hypothetical protein
MWRHQEGLLGAAEYKSIEETSWGQGYLVAYCWKDYGAEEKEEEEKEMFVSSYITYLQHYQYW